MALVTCAMCRRCEFAGTSPDGKHPVALGGKNMPEYSFGWCSLLKIRVNPINVHNCNGFGTIRTDKAFLKTV